METSEPGPRGVRSFLDLLWGTVLKFFGDGCSTMAAALSFYTFFSLPALVTLLLSAMGKVMDPESVQQAIVSQVGGLIGNAGADQVRAIILHANRAEGVTVATTLSLAALAFGATTAFAQLQEALNRIWHVKPDPRRNQLRVFLVKRVFSFGVVITVAFLLLVSLAVSTLLSLLGQRATTWVGAPASVLELIASVISFGVAALLFAVMFRFLPDARIAWRDVRAGALGSALLYTLGKVVIGLYLGGTDPGNAYGAAGSLAVVLIWVYYTSMVLLLGAEFTEQWAIRYGRGIRPEQGAVSYVEEERRVKTG
ncbi:MAG: YihY/virulence factor BrkB family protein [Gemmatimonadaceae bacterium]|nr:YihY/virulence factor BrkB family protein [Gemmatimonadaceae bacterium]